MAYGYPEAAKPFNEDAKAGPHAAEYTRTKHLGDEAVWEACRSREDLSVTMLFLGCVSGPGDHFSVGRPAAVYKANHSTDAILRNPDLMRWLAGLHGRKNTDAGGSRHEVRLRAH